MRPQRVTGIVLLLALAFVFFQNCTGSLVAGVSVTGAAPSTIATVPENPVGSLNQIVFTAKPSTSNREKVFRINLDGSGLQQLTFGSQQDFLPKYSPDGQKLILTRFMSGQYGEDSAHWDTDIIVLDLSTGAETNLTHRAGNDSYPVWSPNGNQIAFLSDREPAGLFVMNSDGSNVQNIVPKNPGNCCADIAWSSDNWILSAVPTSCEGGQGFKFRIEKFHPVLGGEHVIVNDGGPFCTPQGLEQSGDADAVFSPDGKTIFSSRGFPRLAPGTNNTERRLYSFSSDAWQAGKVETDLSLATNPNCVEGVPKVSPDGQQILVFRHCGNESDTGIFLTDLSGSFRKFIVNGFGADWKPISK